MVMVSWRLHFEPLSDAGAPRCPQCGNNAPRVLAKKKRGVKVMFVPVYKGSAGHVTVCTICSNVTSVDDHTARLTLLRFLGSEDTRLHLSPYMQTAEARIRAAKILVSYLSSGECERDVESMVSDSMSEDLVQVRVNYCMAWRLSQEMQISLPNAEEIVYEDQFRPGFYVDEELRVKVDVDDLDRKIGHARQQAGLPRT